MSSIPESQYALFLPSPPPPPSPYKLVTRPVPRPSPTDVLVKIEATALNPADWKSTLRDLSGLFGHGFPAVTGMDGAGVVVEVGSELGGVKVGDRVAFQGWFGMDRGTLQQYALIPGDRLAKIPDWMPFAEAATIPLCLTTAAFGLYSPYAHLGRGGMGLKPFWEDGAEGVYKDIPMLVIGGASSVGQFVIQLAHYQGFSPIITTSSLKHTEYLHSLGTHHIIDRNSSIAEEIQKKYPGLKIPYIYDAVNVISQKEVDLLAPEGILVSVLGLPQTLNLGEDRKVVVAWANPYLYEDLARGMYARLSEFIAKGIIKPSRVEKIDGGLRGVQTAFERFEQGRVSGYKMVILPSETVGDSEMSSTFVNG